MVDVDYSKANYMKVEFQVVSELDAQPVEDVIRKALAAEFDELPKMKVWKYFAGEPPVNAA